MSTRPTLSAVVTAALVTSGCYSGYQIENPFMIPQGEFGARATSDPQDQAASDMPTLAGAGLGLLAGGAFGLFYSAIDHPGLPHLDLPQEIEYLPPFALAGLLVGLIWAWGSPEVTEGVEVSVTPSVGRSDASPGDRKTGWRLVISFRH